VRIIGLRHGQSEYNLLGLCNDDQTRRVDLTELGRDQAREAGRLLASGAFRTVDVLYSSPLLRARRTAEIVAEALGLPVQVEDRLGDIRSGFEGRPVADYLAAIAHDPVDARVGGESLRDYAQRVRAFLDGLRHTSSKNLLLVAHEETLRVIEAYSHGPQLADVAGKSFENCRPYVFDAGGR
jgi:probable phosphoglycerate mutase